MTNYNPWIVLAVTVVIVVGLAGGGLTAVVDVAVFVAWVFGFVRGWQAHWALGLVAFLVAPIGVIIGAVSLATQRNFGHDIVGFFRNAR